MLQMRPPGGGLPYAPFRDVANNFPGLVAVAVEKILMPGSNAVIDAFLNATGVTEDDLKQTVVAFTEFLKSTNDPDNPTMEAALERAGFLSTPPPAQFALAAAIGLVYTGLFYTCARSAHPAGYQPEGTEELLKVAARAREELEAAMLKGAS